MIEVNETLHLDDNDIELSAIRAQGSGGQNVNKVSSAIHLRFNIPASSLPESIKTKLLESNDSRITQDGTLIIKAQSFRTQEKNKEDAISRLIAFIKENTKTQKPRRATKPTKASKQKRMDSKTLQGKKKSLRKKVDY